MVVFCNPEYFVRLIFALLLVIFADGALAKEARQKHVQNKKHPVQTLTPKQQMSAHTEDLRELMLALYEAYPQELAKSTQVGAREMTEWVFDGKANWKFDVIRGAQGNEALNLMGDQAYQGDMVLPLVVGLETLLFKAYGAKNEFDIPIESPVSALATTYCDIQKLQQQLNQQSMLHGNQFLKNVMENKMVSEMLSDTFQTILSRLADNNPIQTACNESR